MWRPRPASRGMRLSPIPREVGTCVSHDVAVWQRVRDGRQIREGRGQSHEGGIWSTSAAWWTGRAGSTGAGSGDVLLRPGDGRARPGAGERRGAEKAQCPRRGHDARRVSRRRVPTGLPPVGSGGMMACASSAGATRPTASLSTPRGHPTPVAFPSRLSATTTARPARRSASPASYSATRACPSSSATSPATR